ncbi:MAG: (5-formylfuran-3-yl)methyl phosphate synthase [Planctomycetota bacterium]
MSVRSVLEAESAIAGGAAIIDVKEPQNGPLGAAPLSTVEQIVRVVAGRRPVTLAAGELTEVGAAAPLAIARLAGLTPAMVKVGLAGLGGGRRWVAEFQRARHALGRGIGLTPVAYADHPAADAPPPAEVVASARALSLRWVMIDTYDKSGAPLFAHVDPAELRRLAAIAHAAGAGFALAGKLDLQTVTEAANAGADVVGVRGIVCGGDRKAAVCRQATKRVANALAGAETPPQLAREKV